MRELHKVETDQAVSDTLCPLHVHADASQIKDAVERLVSLIQGEEGQDTATDYIDELVKQDNGTADGAEMGEDDVIEV